jgi:hypothetical protein
MPGFPHFRRRACRHLQVVALFILALTQANSAPINPNNILVSIGNATAGLATYYDSVREFTPDGVLVQTIPFSYPYRLYPQTEYLRDIVVDQYGQIDAFNGTFNPFLTRYSPDSGLLTHNPPFPFWRVNNNSYYGAIATFQNFVFTLDNGLYGGIVRFDLFDHTTSRYAEGIDFLDVNVGADGKLYGLLPGGYYGAHVNVYDPQTMTLLRTISLPQSISSLDDMLRTIAVDQTGRLFVTDIFGNVHRLDSNGNLQVTTNTGFTHLTDIDIDETGRLILGEQEGGRVIVGDTTLTSFTSFLAMNDPNVSWWTIFVSFAHPVPPPVGPVPTPLPIPPPTPTPVPIHDILVSVEGSNTVTDFYPTGAPIRTIAFNYNNGPYPGSEYLRDIVVDANGVINAFNGTFSPLLTRYSPVSRTFTHRTFANWNLINSSSYGGIAAFQNFIYATDMDVANETNLNGIVRFDTSANTAMRFAAGTNYIDLNMGLDGKLYALNSSTAGVDIFDPSTMALVGHITIPPDISGADYVRGIAADQLGRLFISGYQGVIYRLDSSGGVEKVGATGFSALTDLDIDETGRLVVAQQDGWIIVGDTNLDSFTPFPGVSHPFYFGYNMFVAFAPLAPGPPAQLVSVVSEKTHGSAGTFDIDLPLNGTPGIECRSGGTNGNYAIVFTFANPLVGVGGASVTTGTGTVDSSVIDSNDTHRCIVNLSGVSNRQYIKVTLTDINDSAGSLSDSVSPVIGVLSGDTSGDRSVNSSDVSQTKSQAGNMATASNFREDVNANGVINSADVSLVKSTVGTGLGNPPLSSPDLEIQSPQH